jgi:hypothetical protein
MFLFLGLTVGCPDASEKQTGRVVVEEEEEEEEEENNNNNNNNNHNNDIDAGPVYTGSIAGRVVNRSGASVEGLKVLACSASLCMTADTDANGEYLFTDMSIAPRHVQITDLTDTYMGLLYYQDVIANELNVLSRFVVLPGLTGAPTSLPVATGGTVTLANGALELTAPADAIEYPFGYNDEVIQSEMLSGEEIPPFDVEPWMLFKADSLAFAFFPANTTSTKNVSFKVTQGITQPEGTKYFIWTADFSHGTLHEVGTATVNADGHLVTDPDAAVRDLTAIVLIPDLPDPTVVPDAGNNAAAPSDGGVTEATSATDAGTQTAVVDTADAGS